MIPEHLIRPIQDLVEDRVRVHSESERAYQIRDLMQNERFFRGYHYTVPVEHDGLWNWTTLSRAIKPGEQVPYDYVLNYYRSLCLQLVGLLGKMPNAKCAVDERNDVNSRRARKAGTILDNLWAQWDSETVMADLVASLWKNGTTFGYTPFVANSRRFGMTKVPAKVEPRKIKISDAEFRCFVCGTVTPEQEAVTGVCPGCGTPLMPEMLFPAEYLDIPEVVEYNDFSNGTVEFHLCNAYTVTTPFWLKNLDESPWLQYEYEEHAGKVLRTFPELRERKDIIDGYAISNSGGGVLDEAARGRAQSPYFEHSPKRGMCRFTRFWMEPEMFEFYDDATVRDSLNKDYPDGVRITLVNGKPVHLFPESHREVWAACKPTVSEYLYAQPLGNPARELNRGVNNGYNIMVQTAEKGIPINLYDRRLMNPEALKKNPAQVLDWMGVMPAAGGHLRDSIHTTSSVELGGAVVQMSATSVDAMRQTTLVVPELFGNHGSAQKTLGQVEIESSQAQLPHDTTWNYMRAFIGRAYENAVRQCVKHSPGDMYFADRSMKLARKVQVEEAADVLNGGWHVEVEKSIPMTHGQKRAQFWQLTELPPETQDKAGLWTPNNTGALYDALGNGDLQVPGLEGREKALETIAELLEGEPMEVETGDPMMPVKMLPSVPADEYEDDHLLMHTVVQEWAQKEGRRIRRLPGMASRYANVIAWGMAHLEMANAGMAPPSGAPAPEGGGSGEAPKAPPEPGVPEVEMAGAGMMGGV